MEKGCALSSLEDSISKSVLVVVDLVGNKLPILVSSSKRTSFEMRILLVNGSKHLIISFTIRVVSN